MRSEGSQNRAHTGHFGSLFRCPRFGVLRAVFRSRDTQKDRFGRDLFVKVMVPAQDRRVGLPCALWMQANDAKCLGALPACLFTVHYLDLFEARCMDGLFIFAYAIYRQFAMVDPAFVSCLHLGDAAGYTGRLPHFR